MGGLNMSRYDKAYIELEDVKAKMQVWGNLCLQAKALSQFTLVIFMGLFSLQSVFMYLQAETDKINYFAAWWCAVVIFLGGKGIELLLKKLMVLNTREQYTQRIVAYADAIIQTYQGNKLQVIPTWDSDHKHYNHEYLTVLSYFFKEYQVENIIAKHAGNVEVKVLDMHDIQGIQDNVYGNGIAHLIGEKLAKSSNTNYLGCYLQTEDAENRYLLFYLENNA